MKKYLIFSFLMVATLFAQGPRLIIYSETGPEKVYFSTSNDARACKKLEAIGVCLERWDTKSDLSDEEILTVYKEEIDRIKEQGGFVSVDVLRVSPEGENKSALRRKFLSEHRHSEDEARFFVEGTGEFFLHVRSKVYRVFCRQGDLINVPANTAHWFDMTEEPFFTAIRFFTNDEGWVAHSTEDQIADRFVHPTPRATLSAFR